MNLIIDIGNTCCKWAVFNNNQLVARETIDELNARSLSNLFGKFPAIDQAILSAVRGFDRECTQLLTEKTRLFIELSHTTPCPIANCYGSPETLGLDRLAAAIGGTVLFPKSPLLIIDAGTAITIDVVSSANEYLGGNISPGLRTRFKALNEFTGKLPLVEQRDEFELIGQNTESAIRTGVQQGVLFELEAYIRQLSAQYPGLKTLLTGGDSAFLTRHMKSDTVLVPNLTLTGLNAILDFNSI
ncbi:type III pantothenate kinase [Mangrovibacterium marinum]|uniref:Type III pantothenate kinase n=1 Tax=Mangrovibacterium marinum TaxID=1639118 RepID=A0A2T5C1Z8_9BACT|nr:type III pantothenate kinase [Mangrovibacterium marinum]PTN08720.1 type III pantothenate kinase [Mangrovibacterium marinum]